MVEEEEEDEKRRNEKAINVTGPNGRKMKETLEVSFFFLAIERHRRKRGEEEMT